MTTKWFWSTATLSLSTPFATERAAQPTLPLSGTATITVIASGISDLGIWATADDAGAVMAAHNAADWPTTGYSYSYDVSVAGASLTWSVAFRRLASGGTARGTLGVASGVAGTGIKTGTPDVSGTVNSDASRLSSDLYAWSVESVTNTNMMSSETLTVRMGDVDSWSEGTGLLQAAPTTSLPHLRSNIRGDMIPGLIVRPRRTRRAL